MNFRYERTAGLAVEDIALYGQKLLSEIARIKEAQQKKYNTPYASVSLPYDAEQYESICQIAKEKKELSPTILIVVGIGGSSLGTKAVHQAIKGRFFHSGHPNIRVYFAQTVDADRLYTIVMELEKELQAGNNVIINVVTKSGTTTETIVNFQVLLEVLKKYRPQNYQKYVVVTTNYNSPLWKCGQQEGFSCLPVPEKVGGRYSVFSAVGQFPLLMLDIDVVQLLAGAQSAVEENTQEDIFNNPAALSACITYYHYTQGININDMFVFSVELESVGKWYRQLMAESIGKEKNIHEKVVYEGMTPTVSIGSIDLHSVAQLYLGGPRDKFTTFVTLKQNRQDYVVPQLKYFSEQYPQFVGKSVAEVMHAIAQGTKQAYEKNNRVFCSVILDARDEHSIGQFMQYKMLEIMYLGYLMELNPFDQPNVELYKQETRQFLK